MCVNVFSFKAHNHSGRCLSAFYFADGKLRLQKVTVCGDSALWLKGSSVRADLSLLSSAGPHRDASSVGRPGAPPRVSGLRPCLCTPLHAGQTRTHAHGRAALRVHRVRPVLLAEVSADKTRPHTHRRAALPVPRV
jgi:hypothetical protein